ncbi:hypothetical protein D9615_002354 [Tricholomella constricta]|uniref:Mtf2-like C-terminal domain-containing protein n=1 Tax=Tricholomella constricta TaxID=117010 RepID=A0A8H5HMQ4_9AGAR|nr:hypothetical protein D9615_002354 [Tricholomella constricta]
MLSRCNIRHYFASVPKSFKASRNKQRPFASLETTRLFSTTALVCSKRSSQPNSLFSTDASAWDRVFSQDDHNPTSTNSPRSAKPPSQPRPRQAMTARESNAFNEMFEMIFDAVAAQESGSTASSSSDSAVGIGRGGIDDLIGKLRKYPKRMKWSMESDEVLDRQKEIVNLFTTDQELLEWATDAVFGESQRYEAAARKAIAQAAETGVHRELPMLQPPTYPHLVALLMRTFREKFNDPHLALSMFEHARHLSIASYVFGCSSQAYHELIETRWTCFQDLKGVREALEEMKLNGVKVDPQTPYLVEKIRREVGERHLWVEESELGSGEIWNILAKIEALVAPVGSQNAPVGVAKAKKWDVWKLESLEDEDGDDWGFDQWDKADFKPSTKSGNFKSRQRGSSFGLKA